MNPSNHDHRSSVLRIAWILTLVASTFAGESAMPRLAVQPSPQGAHLIRTDTKAAVVLNGMNYIRLRNKDHSTFEAVATPAGEAYDPLAAEAMLKTLAAAGQNCVRVFVIGRNAGNPGISGKASGELSKAYLDNLADFLRRAAAHRIWVVPALGDGELPWSWKADHPRGNRIFLTRDGIAAKQKYLRLLLEGLRQRGAHLLSTVAFLELQNEMVLALHEWPFDQNKGKLRGPDGKEYDLASDDDRHTLVVNGLRVYHRECIATIKSFDPKLLVGEGIYTWATGGVNRRWRLPPQVSERRQPPLASDLLANGLDVLDIHLYSRAPNMTTEQAVYKDLENTGFFLPAARAALTTIPVLLGEYGSYRETDTTFPAAIARSATIRRDSVQHGFTAGALFWTYDTMEQPTLWPAMTDWPVVLAALPPLIPRKESSNT